MRCVCALAAILLLASPAQARDVEPWPVGQRNLLSAPVSLAETAEGALLRLADGTAWAVTWGDDAPLLAAVDPPAREVAFDMLPDGQVVRGAGNIRRAWLAQPTREYDHAILGDAIEAKALSVETADGQTLSYTAPEGTVFEDLYPRLWDLDGDGEAEAWVIRAGPREGARLEAYTVQAGALALRFAADPIGRGNRWLNPIGVADFTGDGQREVALIQTPHIGGLLILYRPAGERLARIAAVPGLSNHAIGSREMRLHWLGDIDGDGVTDILIPGKTRREMAAFAITGGEFRLIGVTARTNHIETGLVELTPADGGRVILFGDDSPALRWLRLPE